MAVAITAQMYRHGRQTGRQAVLFSCVLIAGDESGIEACSVITDSLSADYMARRQVDQAL